MFDLAEGRGIKKPIPSDLSILSDPSDPSDLSDPPRKCAERIHNLQPHDMREGGVPLPSRISWGNRVNSDYRSAVA